MKSSKFLDRYRDQYGSGGDGAGFDRSGQPAPRGGHRPRTKTPSVDFDVMPDYESSSHDASNGYAKGMKVRHPTFGVGSIYAVEGDGDMQKVSVVFHDQTFKKFVVKYARLEIVG